MAKHNEIGRLGETIASNYLGKKGFNVIVRNYNKKWGELDIVAEKDNCLHFVEVKTVSRKSHDGKFDQEINSYRPEENVHSSKIKRLRRVIQSYLLERKASFLTNKPQNEAGWQFDIACVFVDPEKKVAKVRFMQNIIL